VVFTGQYRRRLSAYDLLFLAGWDQLLVPVIASSFDIGRIIPKPVGFGNPGVKKISPFS